MTKSIRFKIFITFVLLILAFQAAFLIVNNFFLDDIYVRSSRTRMTQVYETYLEKAGNGEDSESLIRELSRDNGITITLVENGEAISTTSFERRPNEIFRITPFILGNLKLLERRPAQNAFFSEFPKEEAPQKILLFIGRLGKNSYMIIEKPYAVINQNTLVARRFIGVSGLLTLVLGSIAIYFASGRITRPVVEMTKTAKAIASQDFDKKIIYESEDELGDLAQSINLISNELDMALTDLKKANAKLTEEIEKERSLEKMRRRFVSSVSHELKNPISMIQAYADGLLHNIAKAPEDKAEYAEIIVDESNKMSRLIKDLLDLSAYESGTFSMERTSFDAVELIREISGRQMRFFEEKGIGVKLKLPETLTLYADKLRIEQVLANFLANALRHAKAGGFVEIALEKRHGNLRLAVFNSGEPISENELEHIWTSFYKIREEGADPSAGTGLGLAIARAIAELHGGSCGAENQKGGVSFWVDLPQNT